jgi:hypothetical protein
MAPLCVPAGHIQLVCHKLECIIIPCIHCNRNTQSHEHITTYIHQSQPAMHPTQTALQCHVSDLHRLHYNRYALPHEHITMSFHLTHRLFHHVPPPRLHYNVHSSVPQPAMHPIQAALQCHVSGCCIRLHYNKYALPTTQAHYNVCSSDPRAAHTTPHHSESPS